ncbi:ankyrin repeat protein [Bipolaris maydis]|nr:ankyrin repeat protein [Bipolaris maydis]
MPRQPRREEYTVGWVCALPIESAAARSMLDEKYDTPDPEPGERWDDIYFTGSIAGHNVVIACLPGRTGTSSAATLAARMQGKFQGIKFGLMVGIGGGVPGGQADIRLGDVVVSAPQKTFGGVVQYDMGKATPTDTIRTGSLDSPFQILLSAAGALQSDALIGESKLLNILSKTQHIPSLQRCESSADVLYEASYNHEGGRTCANCRSDKQVNRPQRKREEVVVHHGTIASGNQVMKNATVRDRISQELGGVLCFEMEAAGLMNSFPCLVIRGISDYSDSHKNDQWQGYAAATAAAYARELLLKIPTAQVMETARAEDVINDTRKRDACSSSPTNRSSKRRKTEGPSSQMPEIEERGIVLLQERTRPSLKEDRTHHPQNEAPTHRVLSEEQRQRLLESLQFDQIDERKNTIKRAHAKTCEWLLQSAPYLEWLETTKRSEHHGFLWIKGKAGAGKSTLMKFALERAPKEVRDSSTLSFFFNARGSTLEKSTTGTYRSLLLQLLTGFPKLQEVFDSLHLSAAYFDANYEWRVELLKDLLEKAILMLGKTPILCFIDALDECDGTEIRDMIEFFEHIGNLSTEKDLPFFTCFSSRHYPHITIDKGLELVLEGQEGHNQDIINYIGTVLKIGKSKKALKIKEDVRKNAKGIFMWVVLVVRMLNEESDRGRLDRLEKKLLEIPTDLHDLFRDILTRDSENKEQVVLCIQWVLFAKVQLSPKQLYYAILSGIDPDEVSAWDPDEVDQDLIKKFILDSSKGLTDITASKDQKIQFIHESVRDFLLKENGLAKIWPEYQHNFFGQSHDKLKQCSWNYINTILDKSSDILDIPSGASSMTLKELRSSAEQKFPLLEYAVHNVFYHADLAEGHRISQSMFLDQFHLESWVQLDNLLENYKIRRHQKTVSLLYILAELDCANLIKSHIPLDKVLDVTEERYGCPLFAAIALGNGAAIRVLLTAIEPASPGTGTNCQQLESDTIVAAPIQGSHRDFVYARGKSFLSNAIRICPEQAMKRLLKSPACNLESPSSDTEQILLEASSRGYESVVKLLLDNSKGLFNLTPDTLDKTLHKAVEVGNEPIVKMLVLKGGNVDAMDNGENTLHVASRKGIESIAIFLLDRRPDLLDSRGPLRYTPLMSAIEYKHTSLAQKLIQRGANVHLESTDCTDALYWASLIGDRELVMLLLDEGAKIKSQNGHLGNTLYRACLRGDKNIVKLLIERGADVNAKCGEYGSALQIACSNGRRDIVELLLERGADVNAEGGVYNSALQIACSNGRRDIVELLLDRGADINAKGGSALQTACSNDRKDIVELLLERGANINAKYGEYGSALQIACSNGRRDIVELLLERGADVNAKGGSALQTACSNGRRDICTSDSLL